MRWLCGLVIAAAGCGGPPIAIAGEFGRAIGLATGDASPLLRLSYIDEGCPGDAAVGGCDGSGTRACQPLLIDSLAPITALKHPDPAVDVSRFGLECLEVRSASGLAADPVDPADLSAAVARFRFRDLPIIRAPQDPQGWSWVAGNGAGQVDPGGVLGGNLLREIAVQVRRSPGEDPTVTLYKEFPGGERDLADGGRAFLPLQFPGRLLGRRLGDRCDIGSENCRLPGFDLELTGDIDQGLETTRMVLDACVAAPPCGVQYTPDATDEFAPGSCTRTAGPDLGEACVPAFDPDIGGQSASLVVATGIPGLVLFADSVGRMFGDLAGVPTCAEVEESPDLGLSGACIEGNAGVLFPSGWTPAGQDVPLVQLRVRSVALVPGLAQTRGEGPCRRVDGRLVALVQQCTRFTDEAAEAGDIRDTNPPYAAPRGDDDRRASATSLAMLGEATRNADPMRPATASWIPAVVVPDSHPLALSVRRDVAPEAIEPDGLLGTTLFEDTDAILDYTDQNPGVRLRCLDPRSGDCQVAPDCVEDGTAACCYGLPLPLLVDFIARVGDETCCVALSGAELDEIQQLGFCAGLDPP